ncbi:hypothetical protein DQ04_12011010 [Trypanosoma grayi]|uniref:hypothetical protein n=1 Tax=Trypanosoma grayi TaxID=71804 RepID=UPI0004F437CA|nr:hypothetical protein DQ04_12011010 [Trypanosoma grayi]KEG06834.1 hypothetical protein DQ04_12011010 [Trypanosoma grayi]
MIRCPSQPQPGRGVVPITLTPVAGECKSSSAAKTPDGKSCLHGTEYVGAGAKNPVTCKNPAEVGLPECVPLENELKREQLNHPGAGAVGVGSGQVHEVTTTCTETTTDGRACSTPVKSMQQQTQAQTERLQGEQSRNENGEVDVSAPKVIEPLNGQQVGTEQHTSTSQSTLSDNNLSPTADTDNFSPDAKPREEERSDTVGNDTIVNPTANSDTTNSGGSPSTAQTPETGTSVEDRANTDPTSASALQGASKQNDAVQAQPSSAPHSPNTPGETILKPSDTSLTETAKDTQNADNSFSPVWLHAPLLLLALFGVAAA